MNSELSDVHTKALFTIRNVYTKNLNVEPFIINPLRPNSDLSQTFHCNIQGLSVREVTRIENVITQVKFY